MIVEKIIEKTSHYMYWNKGYSIKLALGKEFVILIKDTSPRMVSATYRIGSVSAKLAEVFEALNSEETKELYQHFETKLIQDKQRKHEEKRNKAMEILGTL